MYGNVDWWLMVPLLVIGWWFPNARHELEERSKDDDNNSIDP